VWRIDVYRALDHLSFRLRHIDAHRIFEQLGCERMHFRRESRREQQILSARR
jgi:hypothetical protein